MTAARTIGVTLAWLKARPQDAGGPPPEEDPGPAGLLAG